MGGWIGGGGGGLLGRTGGRSRWENIGQGFKDGGLGASPWQPLYKYPNSLLTT